MRKNLFTLVGVGAMTLALTSCFSSKQVTNDAYSPEESTLSLVKVTDEGQNSVLSAVTGGLTLVNYSTSATGVSGKNRFAWTTSKTLAMSPDGLKLAYISRQNGKDNVMVRNTTSGVATQRTFRNVGSFCWGSDGRLYFTDLNGTNSYICSVDATSGSVMSQHTNGNVRDINPVLSGDGKLIYFTRLETTGPAIWSLNKKDGTLTSCTRGFNPCIIPGTPHTLYVVRNSTERRSEIWRVNYERGEESLVLSDENRSFTNPALSPEGRMDSLELATPRTTKKTTSTSSKRRRNKTQERKGPTDSGLFFFLCRCGRNEEARAGATRDAAGKTWGRREKKMERRREKCQKVGRKVKTAAQSYKTAPPFHETAARFH